MAGSWLLTWLGCAEPQPVALVVTASWPGAEIDAVEAQLALPLERVLGALPGAQGLVLQSLPGRALLKLSLPPSSAQQLADALDSIVFPEGVVPQAQAAFEHTSDWLLSVPQARELLPQLNMDFGLDSAWSDTLPDEVVEVYLPQGTDLDALRSELVPGRELEQLRARGAQVRPAPPRVWATWDGQPVALVHVGRPVEEVRRWFDARSVAAVEVPHQRAVHLCAWGDPAEPLVQALTEAGAEHLLVVSGRPLPAGEPEPGRVEIVAQWPEGKSVPALAFPGVQLTPLPGSRSLVTGPEPVLLAAGPPPRDTWEVEIDAERAAASGVPSSVVSEALHLALRGQTLRGPDRQKIELRVGEKAQKLEELASLPVQGQVRLGDVAQIRAVEEVRVRLRADRQPAAFVVGEIPEGAVLLSREPLLRYPW